jgi:hypothetical protein
MNRQPEMHSPVTPGDPQPQPPGNPAPPQQPPIPQTPPPVHGAAKAG